MANTSKATSKKPTSKKLYWVIPVVILVLGFAVFFAYNKYLDRQNVAEMEQLLADFEQLKTDAEEETGEKFYIEADCSTGGEKFKSIYSCSVRLKSSDKNWNSNVSSFMIEKSKKYSAMENCELLSSRSVGFDLSEDNFRCVIAVTDGNISKAEEIYYDYDTSPGSPF